MSTIYEMIINLHKNMTEQNAFMAFSIQRPYEIGYLILFTALWILVFLTVTGILKWDCCQDCITRLLLRILSNMTDTTRRRRVQFVQRIGLPDNAMERMSFRTTPPSQNQSTVDSSSFTSNAITSRSELILRMETTI